MIPEMKRLVPCLQNKAGISHPDPCPQLVRAKLQGCKCSSVAAAQLLGTSTPGWAWAQASSQGWVSKMPFLLHLLSCMPLPPLTLRQTPTKALQQMAIDGNTAGACTLFLCWKGAEHCCSSKHTLETLPVSINPAFTPRCSRGMANEGGGL